jgi:hypothetical protein
MTAGVVALGSAVHWLSGFAQFNRVDRPARGRGDSGYRQAIIDYRVVVTADTCYCDRVIVSPNGLPVRQTVMTQVAIIKVIPIDEMIVIGAQAKVVTLGNSVAVISQTHAGGEVRAGR